MDAQHRCSYLLGNVRQGTWHAAVDRLLLGVAMEEGEQFVSDVLPLDDVDSGDIDLAGRFAELIDRVGTAFRAMTEKRPVPDWVLLLGDLVLSLGAPLEPWQAIQLRRELGEVAESAGETDVRLDRSDVTVLLQTRLAGRPTRASFRTGTLTVCTLVPMRSVPHRVVCLLGMDDGAFPRQGIADGDDLLVREPRTGERDVRSEDRQLFLDAICAAQEHLVITYTGADPRSGAEVPPCVPLSELLDAVDATASTPSGEPGRRHVVVRHPLQPFDRRNFLPGQLGRPGPFSFDPSGLAGARAAAQPRRPVPSLVPHPLSDPPPSDLVDLDDLVRFLQHPAKAFLRQRLKVSTASRDEEPDDAITVELGGLQGWAIGERVLQRCLSGTPPGTAARLEHLRGALPPGPLGNKAMRDIGTRVVALLGASEIERQTDASALDIAVPLGGGRTLSGTVSGVRGSTVLSVSYSTLAAKHRLTAWVRYLAVVAATGDAGYHAVTVGRDGAAAARSTLHGVEAAAAREALTRLVQLRDAGLREPLPLALETSADYARWRHRKVDAEPALSRAELSWKGGFSPERDDAAHVLVFGAHAPFTAAHRRGPEPRGGVPGRVHPFRRSGSTRLGAAAHRRGRRAAVKDFDVLGALPKGTTVLEASAGTGKTFTIAGLVTRYVAEGVARLDELLVVTFGRIATQELRDRVRERLVSARDGLIDPVAARAAENDALLRHLAAGSDAEVAARRRRLVVALASFDAATIATTHEFCKRVLTGLGTAADVDAGVVLVEDLDDLITEVVQDLYLRKWGHGDVESPPLTLTAARDLARAVVNDGQAVLVPGETNGEETPAVRRRFAARVRLDVDLRKRQRRILGFDDVLTRLQRTLGDPQSGPSAAARLRARYRVVLVDEFQDTDPVQWDVLRLAFHGAATLVLIGDPKQAIYAFRGADVQAYLAAAELAQQRATLAQNWRSDPELLRGLEAMFRGAALGDTRIVVQPVSAAHVGRSLDTSGAPVRIRVVQKGHQAKLPVGPARDLVIRDLVAEVVDMLASGALLSPRDASVRRPVRPGDIAVIVPTKHLVDVVHTALLAAGIPAVQRSTMSVFRTAAGSDWIVLLEALEQPHRSGRLRRLAISPFVGLNAAELEAADVDRLGLRLRYWIRVFEERGVAAVFETISRDQRLPSRLLCQVDGERLLTDLRHVGEALHTAAMAGQLGLTASLEWLRRRVAESGTDTSVERSRRLDSDAEAVQVITVWASKGLEFPIVHVPFAWDRHLSEADIPLFHEDSGRRVRNVGGAGSAGFRDDQLRHRREQLGEDVRVLYVAMTRAQAQVTAWWAPSDSNTPRAPLHRLLFTDDPAVGIQEKVSIPDDAAAFARLSALAVDGCLSVDVVPARAPGSWQRPPDASAVLAAAQLSRGLDTSWRRTSYSALTAAVHDQSPTIGSEPEVGEKDDEPATPVSAATGDEAWRGIASPMAALAGGTAFGTLVHAVLEHLDPTSPELADDVREHVRVQLARLGPAGLDAGALSRRCCPRCGHRSDRLRTDAR